MVTNTPMVMVISMVIITEKNNKLIYTAGIRHFKKFSYDLVFSLQK